MATSTGYGGVNYATTNAAGKKNIVNNQNKIANDQKYKQDEINRTLSVIANREKQGLNTSDQQKYLTVNLGYTTPTNQSNAMVQAANNVKSTPQATYTPPTSQTADTLNRINDFINKQSQFRFTTPDPFTYDQNSDPAYQAQLAEAKRNVENQQADTNAFLRAGGQGKSSYSEMVANQVGSNAMQSIANDLVPQLMQQAYQRYNDDANRNMQAQQLNYGVGQDTISSLSNLYGLQDNEYFQKPITEAQLTGNYLPTEARQAINNILGLKQQAEASGITAQERTALSQQADVYRTQLQALGIDPSFYGANRNYNQASASNPGIRTLAGQQLDMSRQDQAFNQQFSQDQFSYQKARDLISDQKWQAQFDQDVNQFGLQFALNRQVQLGGLTIDQARLALSQDDNARAWAALDWEMSNPSAASSGGLTANQVLQSMKGLYTEPIYTNDDVGEQIKIGSQITTDSSKRKQLIQNVVDSGLSNADIQSVLSSLGFSKKEMQDAITGATSGN
ncbi:hypothetical protein D3C74_151260 [compost metagenome]